MAPHRTELPLPPHSDPPPGDAAGRPADAGGLQRAAEDWARRHAIPPAREDRVRVRLLVVDAQWDFSHPEGALYVAGRSGTGGLDANRRLAAFVYRHLHRITEITCTLDTHHPFQVFFPCAHLDEQGRHPPPHTEISAEEYLHGRYRPDPAMAHQLGVEPGWLAKQFVHYCQQLERSGKHRLCLWPYHCLLGSPGHRLAGPLEEARLFHAFARGAANVPETKGDNPLSERYSVFQEEVATCWDGRPIPGVLRNHRLIRSLLEEDAVLVAGLASSHCVRESVADLLGAVRARDPALARRIYLLEDCTAPVVIPGGPDFTDEAERAFRAFEEAGMRRVRSTDPLEAWLEVPRL